MLVVVAYLYGSSVVQWAMEIAIAFGDIHALLMVPDVPIPDRAELTGGNVLTYSICQQVLFMFNVRENFQPHGSDVENYSDDHRRWCRHLAHLGYLRTENFGNLGAQHSIARVLR
jgi:hypothetical protein